MAYRVRGHSDVLTDQLQIDSGKRLESEYDVRAFTYLNDALEQEPTVTFVCNPTSLHVKAALAAVRAGSHLFVEKPLSHNLDEVQTLISAAESQA